MKRRLALGQQYLGASLVTVAGFAVSMMLGLLVAGLALIAFGLAGELGGN